MMKTDGDNFLDRVKSPDFDDITDVFQN